MPLSMEVGLGPGDSVVDGDPAPHKKGTALTQFLAHVDCGQTTGWIKMPLGTEVTLSPGNVVIHRVPASPLQGAHPLVFGLCLLWQNSWMNEYATWYGSRPRRRPDGFPALRERGTAPPLF